VSVGRENNITVVDVRGAEDFAKGHIPGGINLPHGSWESPTDLSKDRNNIVYCYTQTCHLAAKTCVTFASLGYPVMERDGGFEAWKENGFEIEHEATNQLKKTADKFLHRRH
jgi:rhodanese-related sulfurtransferase